MLRKLTWIGPYIVYGVTQNNALLYLTYNDEGFVFLIQYKRGAFESTAHISYRKEKNVLRAKISENLSVWQWIEMVEPQFLEGCQFTKWGL